MKSKIAQRIMANTPEETKIFVRKYGDIVVRVYQILREKGLTQKELAEKMGKNQSEISKWLNGDHNFTLRSLAKLEAELGEDIIYVPQKDTFHLQIKSWLRATASPQQPLGKEIVFIPAKEKQSIQDTVVPIAS